MKKQIIITVYDEDNFQVALKEIKATLDYENIEYDYEIKDLTTSNEQWYNISIQRTKQTSTKFSRAIVYY